MGDEGHGSQKGYIKLTSLRILTSNECFGPFRVDSNKFNLLSHKRATKSNNASDIVAE